jgi:hypothetical protein
VNITQYFRASISRILRWGIKEIKNAILWKSFFVYRELILSPESLCPYIINKNRANYDGNALNIMGHYNQCFNVDVVVSRNLFIFKWLFF